MKPRLILSAAALLALSGCSLIPDYKQPEAPVAQSWPAGVSTPQGTDAKDDVMAINIGWREFFIDDSLRQLIELALTNNRDLRIAALNVEKMQATYRIQRSELFPSVNAYGQQNAQRIPEDLRAGPEITRQYSVGLSVNAFELDFFGRIRSLNKQALEQYLATEEARRSTQTMLVSQLASTWLNLLADQEHLNLARATLKNQTDAYELIKKTYEAGIGSELDLRQAQTSVESARLDEARYISLVAQDKNMIHMLVGVAVPEHLLKQEKIDNQAFMQTIPVGLSSSVLLQRPDILQAEHALKGANANIGAARAAFFPSISITAGIGTGSNELDNLFSSGSRLWTFAPQITLPIFNAGRLAANLDAAELQRDINIAQYEKAIQNAFREVADALADRNTLEDQIKAQAALAEASSRSFELSSARFKHGINSYLTVLDSQRSMYAAQQGLITVRLAQQANLLTLYKTLGGGWSEADITPPQES